MSSKYKFRNQDKLYFVSFATVYWLDVFIRNEYKEIVLDSLRVCQEKKGLGVYSWVIMISNKAHRINWLEVVRGTSSASAQPNP